MMTKSALIVVDVQNDFLPGGALAVTDGDAVVPVANALMDEYDLVVATRDWHPAEHGSFAVNHPGRDLFEEVDLDGLPQVLWPVHCVQGTAGAEFAAGLDQGRITRVFEKGVRPEVDSYSGFYDNGRRYGTGLAEWLREQGVGKVGVCGLATDYCVKFTALDAVAEGFEVELRREACRGVNLRAGDVDAAVEEMARAGVLLR